MNAEDVFLWTALGCLVAAAVLRLRSIRNPAASEGAVVRLLLGAWISLALATALLLLYFLSARITIEYVFTYTSTQTPLHYRVAGLWGGQKGTLLLWALFSALFLWINGRAWRRKKQDAPDPAGFHGVLAWTELLGCLVTVGFVVLLLASGLFARTDPFLLNARPSGTGLQPVLRTPFMLIHPPLQFVSYAVATVLFSAGLAGVITRQRSWADLALPWTRFGFVVATTGLGLGGLWAYYVLNFGGYWAWDPVETANLLAWFPLLLLLHALLYYRKRGMYAAAAPIFAILTLLMDLFSTIATRTGLWVSVHAFTDPSRNFASDPLLRLLNILDTGVLLQGLMSMFMLALLAIVGGYVYRLRVDSEGAGSGMSGVKRGAYVAALGFIAILAALALIDVRLLVSGMFEVADLVGFGNAPAGLGVLGFGAALVVASPALGSPDEPRPKRSWWDLVDTPKVTFLGVLFLSLAFLVVFLLQVLSVNGYNRLVYDERAPFIGLPILLTMPIALSHSFVGKRLAVALSVGAAVLGILLALVFREHWHIWLVVPAFAWALFGAFLKLFKVSDQGSITDRRLRLSGGMLLAGGIITMFYWANPPSRIDLFVTTWRPSIWLAPVGILVGLVGVLAAVGVLRVATKRAHRYGSLALVLGIGFGIGTLLGVVAFLLAESRRAVFPDAAAPKPVLECIRGVRREMRKTGVYLMHVTIVLGLLGYALSTYAQREETDAMLRPDQPALVHGYEITLVGSEGVGWRQDESTLEEIHGIVEIRRDGELLDRIPLVMWLELPHHYAERVAVERFAREDLYLRPMAMITPERDFVAHEDNVVLTSGQVDGIAITAKTLPGMHLVWGSLWAVVAGMLVNLAAHGSPWEFSRPKPSSSVD
jgi:cytochrome c-type biogenesis protein CcmF